MLLIYCKVSKLLWNQLNEKKEKHTFFAKTLPSLNFPFVVKLTVTEYDWASEMFNLV